MGVIIECTLFLSENFHKRVGEIFLHSFLYVILLSSTLLQVNSITSLPDTSTAMFLTLSHSLNQ